VNIKAIPKSTLVLRIEEFKFLILKLDSMFINHFMLEIYVHGNAKFR